ncbi:hypothetical protein [Streptomyces mexicanus]|uniref:hypothetical protein n=1 Tax=Streptomyces mexicanus TaxID=178566 RepID=UPI00365E6F78
MTTATSHVDEQVQARIAAARLKREQRQQRRAELDENRAHGLQARHLAKMRRWADEDGTPEPAPHDWEDGQ